MGEALEGHTPSIMNPNVKAAPTASSPFAGFKPSGSNDKTADADTSSDGGNND